jgi:hypothetical protein
MPTRFLLLLGLASILVHATGCAQAACTRVKDDRRAFLQRRGSGDAAQMVVAVPMATLSQSLSWPLAKLKPISVPLQLPGLDLGLGTLEISLRTIQLLPSATEGQLALRVRFALASRGRAITSIDLDATVAPQILPQTNTVRLTLRPQDLVRVRPSLPAGERARFSAFLRTQLPAGAEALLGGGLDSAAEKVLADLVERNFPAVRDKLLAGLDDLVDVEIELPPVPLQRVVLRSPGQDLELWLHTTMPAAPLAPGPARVAGSDPRLVQVRMSGSAAAELANQGIVRGQIPARYDESGEASPTGAFEAGVAWRSGPRPLRIHAWKQQPVCAHVEFAATPQLSAAQGELVVAVPDAKIEKVTGAAKARVAFWFSGLGRQTFAFSQAIAGATQFDLLGVDYDATPLKAAAVGDDLFIDLSLAPSKRTPARKP